MSNIVFNKRVPQNFFPDKIKVRPEHYKFGDARLPKNVLVADGNWQPFIPVGESQYKNNFDPQSCPMGGTLNAFEAMGIQLSKKYKQVFQSDLSERYGSIMMGMNGYGGSPHDAAEAIRWWGAVPEAFLPFDKTIDSAQKYFSPRPMTYDLFKVGFSWLNKYKPCHDWLFSPAETISLQEKQNRIIENLKYSPVGVSVYAWSRHADELYYKDGPDIHWVIVIYAVPGKYYLILDTYPDETGSYLKKLDWKFNFGFSKRYNLDYTDAFKAKLAKLGGEDVADEPVSEARLAYLNYLITGWLLAKFMKRV